ncbi:AAA family ATPase, partial [Desulfonatronovibrio magnus]|uniref:AAA family ATPase n=1 Tax=Desulfonatronovibrio magnus TaxID=698827 RepID=UPI0005EAE5B2
MKKLPIGIQTFEKLITNNNYYVDKTSFIKQLTQEGEYYFLSRPRRFGKSLLISTIKAAFQGKK